MIPFLLFVLGLAVPAVVDGSELAVGRGESEIIATIRRLRDPDHPSIEDLVPELAEGGRLAPELLFDVLVRGSLPATAGVAAQRLSSIQRDLVLASFERLGRGFVFHAIGPALQAPDSVGERRAAIEVLGAIGTGDELMRVFDLAITDAEQDPLPGLEEAFEGAMTSILGRDEHAFSRLRRDWRTGREELYPTLVLAVGGSGSPEAAGFLSDVILWDDDLAAVAMAQVPRVGKSSDERVNEELRIRIRPSLVEDRPGPCRAASLALAELEDLEAIPYLIDLLSSDIASDGVKGNATWALQKLTGLALPANARRWNHWYEGELEWMRRDKARELRRILSHDQARVAKGLREVAKHPLVKEELVQALRSALIDRNEDVRVLAGKALATYGDQRAVSWLVDALEDPHPQVRHAAWESLVELTGLELTPLEWAMGAFVAGN